MMFTKISSKLIMIFFSTVLLSGPLMISTSFSETQSSGAIWQLIYVSSKDCHVTTTNTAIAFSELTSKYFDMYQFANVGKNPNCVLASEYPNYQFEGNLDLLILIFDKEAAEKTLYNYNLDGMYIHIGNNRLTNHTVIVCDCFKDKAIHESAKASWVLSHELSHFILSYKGYSKANVEKLIHEKEHFFLENCIVSLYVENYCTDVKTTIRTETVPKNFVVMTPYQPAIGNTLVKYISDDFTKSEVLELQRDLTKMWLTGLINETAYIETVKRIVDPPIMENSEFNEEFNIPNGFVIPEHTRNAEIDWQTHLNPKLLKQENMAELLSFIPFKADDNDKEQQSKNIPHWFKERALMWSEKKIANKIFLDGLEHLIRMGTIKLN